MKDNINSELQMESSDLKNRGFRLSEHPWISLFVLVVLMVSTLIVSRNFLKIISRAGYEINPFNETIFGTIVGIILFFGIIPFVLGLPYGRTSLSGYLSAIRLQRPQSYYKHAFVIVPCIVILFSCWLFASFIYNQLFLGGNLAFFFRQLMDTSRALPPKNWSIITATGSIFEEVLLRGIFLSMLLKGHTERKSIMLSAGAFGGIHLLNLLNGPSTTNLLIGVFAQILWCTMYGLFYGYLFLKTNNLIPCMIMHYAGNGFISFFWITPNASFQVYTILMLTFYVGIVPTILSILWVKYASRAHPYPGKMISPLKHYLSAHAIPNKMRARNLI
jgi:membrane protease YdiL (CAAX protease family)